MSLTPNQAAMIAAIARNDFTEVNGAMPKSLDEIGWVWADGIIETKEDRGTFTSLVNAGLARHNLHTKRDACVTLTEAGFAAFLAMAAAEVSA